MAWSVQWKLWDVPFEARSLRFWQRDRVREQAESIVKSCMERHHDQQGGIPGMLGQEFRDWVLRGGERFMPVPDQVLDTYSRAQRGLPGFYHPLMTGADGKNYLGLGSIGDIGEGVALLVIESAGSAGLDQLTVSRPIGDAPDFIFQDRRDPIIRGIAEVKASEKADPGPGLIEGVTTLLDVFRGWQRHRPLTQSPGLALAAHVTRDGFVVSVIRLRFSGSELVRIKDNDFFDCHAIATVRKALWAGVTDDALVAMATILSSADKDTADTELASVRKIRTLATATLGAARRHRRPGRRQEDRPTKHWAREELGNIVGEASPAEWGEIEKQAGKLMARADEDAHAPNEAVMWSEDGGVGPWRYAARSKADGVEVRGFLARDVAFDNGVLVDALRAGSKRYHRLQSGAQAVSCWADGIEWTAFGDGRLLGWIPEVGEALEERQRLVAEARQVLDAWRVRCAGGRPTRSGRTGPKRLGARAGMLLECTHPETPNHPEQAYRTRPRPEP